MAQLHDGIDDIQSLTRKAQPRNRAIVRGVFVPQSRLLPLLPPFVGRLPRVLTHCPQFVSPCRESGFRCRIWGSPATNLNPPAAFLKLFASIFSAFARNLARLAAIFSPPAAIYNLLPQSWLHRFQTLNPQPSTIN
jgi:hypothetical protein